MDDIVAPTDVVLHRRRRKLIGNQLLKRFGDGKWRYLVYMAQKIGYETDHVEATLHQIRKRNAYGANAEFRKVGTEVQWRLFIPDKTVSSVELAEKLRPIIDGLTIEGQKNVATVSIPTVAFYAAQLRQLIKEWSE